MYTQHNYRTKKDLKQAIASGEHVTVFQPGPLGIDAPSNGRVALEGPHYPEPHRWYASGTMQDGRLIKVT